MREFVKGAWQFCSYLLCRRGEELRRVRMKTIQNVNPASTYEIVGDGGMPSWASAGSVL